MAYNSPQGRVPTFTEAVSTGLPRDPKIDGRLSTIEHRIYEICGHANSVRGALSGVVIRVLGPHVSEVKGGGEVPPPATSIQSINAALDQLESEIHALDEHAKRLQDL
jgi:hypothetical protein